jgi:arabinofuranan 3-O-arabinosyltransferase
MVWLWRSRVAYDLKAAALACGVLLATSYLYMYDIVVLAVAVVAFLLRYALERGFWPRAKPPGLAQAAPSFSASPTSKPRSASPRC